MRDSGQRGYQLEDLEGKPYRIRVVLQRHLKKLPRVEVVHNLLAVPVAFRHTALVQTGVFEFGLRQLFGSVFVPSEVVIDRHE